MSNIVKTKANVNCLWFGANLVSYMNFYMNSLHYYKIEVQVQLLLGD